MKVRTRYRFRRLWLSLAAILVGLLTGYAIGRESVLHATRSNMAATAALLLEREEELTQDVVTTLKRASATPYPLCSDQDLILLRKLTFNTRFLKDVGREHDHSFLCSAMCGKVDAPLPSVKPEITLPTGLAMFRNYPVVDPAGDRAEVTAYRDTNAIISPDVFADFPQEPIHYAVGVVDRARNTIYSGRDGAVPVPAGVLDSSRALRKKGVLYLARCSSRFTVCAVTHISLQEVSRSNRPLLAGFTETGGLAGALCATVLLRAGTKRRSHTNQLKRAILMGKLSVAYQPIVELGSNRIVGAEALARWTDEDGDSIRPETILALAEAEGFVSEITRFVLTRSVDELTSILNGNPDFQLSINLAPTDLADPRLLLLLDEKLRESPLHASSITFELTERATSNREVAVAAIRRLRDRGHAVFIDDFGTGYSNLAYLTELNVDGIKINRSFIATLGTDSVTASIVPQILAVAKALNLQVVVQGIEREEQATYFAQVDPNILGQGWFYGMPIPARSLMYLCAEKSE